MRLPSKQVQLGILLLILPVLYQFYQSRQRHHDSPLSQLAASWRTHILTPQRPLSRVAVGVNANLDLVVSATPLLEKLGLSPGQPVDHTHLASALELQEQVAYSMLHCAGTERVFSSQPEFQKVVTAAYQLPHQHFVGGNAALMAVKVQETLPDAKVMLAGPIGGTLRDLLHSQIYTPTFTPGSQDEVHLIMEYPKGQRWGKITSTCANRVIMSHDVSNAKMVALEEFQKNLDSFQPDLVILSGAHLMQGESDDFKKKRLVDIAGLLGNIPARTPVHSELATIGDLNYLRDLAAATFPLIDSLGLNEQELLSLAKAVGANFDFDRIPSKPDIPTASDLLHWLMETYTVITRKESRLTRVHFHTLSFHIVATLVAPRCWHNSKSGVLAGSRIAALQACDLRHFDPTKFELRVPLTFPLSVSDKPLSQRVVHITPESPVASWQRDRVEYVLTPVLVCKTPLKTVGLGDAISAMGLLHSEFRQP